MYGTVKNGTWEKLEVVWCQHSFTDVWDGVLTDAIAKLLVSLPLI